MAQTFKMLPYCCVLTDTEYVIRISSLMLPSMRKDINSTLPKTFNYMNLIILIKKQQAGYNIK